MSEAAASARAAIVAALLAVDPAGLGGITLRSSAGETRDLWLRKFQALLPDETPWRRLPPGLGAARLMGGLDLAATLSAGRPVAERGLMAQADGGFLVAPMAERLDAAIAGPLGLALDQGDVPCGAVSSERDGAAQRMSARFSLILLDEGIADERAPIALSERLAFVETLGPRPDSEALYQPGDIAAARDQLPNVTMGADMIEALCQTSLALGISSMRPVIFAVRAAKAAAALDDRDAAGTNDVALAAALVLAPRATSLPAAPEDEATEEPVSEAEEPETPPDQPLDMDDAEAQPPDAGDDDTADATLSDQILEAAKAAIPEGLLAALSAGGPVNRQASAGRAGLPRQSAQRGRPAGVRRGMPNQGARLALIETLRAAAPWQAIRRRDSGTQATNTSDGRILIRREDFRIARYKQKSETTTIFVVDASGSAALNRLAEVKGAVELILADCYIRRDSVALIAFRGTQADLILPPTRSLTRAKRALAGQPGGGGTPLALAIDAASLLAATIRRKGPVPTAVFLTDGRANITRDGKPGRAEAEKDALQAARGARALGLTSLLIDISPRPTPAARDLAAAMGARYLPLPYADAHLLSKAVRAAPGLA